jgi:hypothetical protein
MGSEMTRKEQLLKAVEGLTYKPGWNFAVEDYVGLGLSDRIIALNIKVDATCVDSGEPITIDRSFPVDDGTTPFEKLPSYQLYARMVPRESQMEAFIAGCIEEIEKHESQEWLKFNGKRHYPDPDHD